MTSEPDTPEPAPPGGFRDFLRHNKRWWLTPIIIVLILLGLLVTLAGRRLAPFLYPLF